MERRGRSAGLLALSQLGRGQRAEVVELAGGREFRSRMRALGFIDGTELQVDHNRGRGPLIVRARGPGWSWGVARLPRSESGFGGTAMDERRWKQASGTGATRGARVLTVALAGQPNVGKSTVFNLLTGLRQRVGNWPGKTVEHRTGVHFHGGITLEITDLPGTYGLGADSAEERIARDYLIRERPDVVIMMADATGLERNLYLLTELLALPIPVVLGLNMIDVAESQGFRIEPHVLEAALGLNVVPLVASRAEGLDNLVEAALRTAQNPRGIFRPSRPEPSAGLRAILAELQERIADRVPSSYPADWTRSSSSKAIGRSLSSSMTAYRERHGLS